MTMTEHITKEQAELIVESALREYIRTGAVETAFEELYSLPAADVAPVRHGRWTRIDYHDARCSECGHKTYYPDRISLYCPECGARMDGGADQ